jgi:hypothetical protein
MSARGLIAAIPTILKRQSEQSVLNLYLAECLRVLTENTAKIGGGGYISVRYCDLINSKPEEKRTPEEIVSDFKTNLARIRGDTV